MGLVMMLRVLSVEYDAWHYAYADDLRMTAYYRYDEVGKGPASVLDDVKRHLAAGIPVEFGFFVYQDVIRKAAGDGRIAAPLSSDKVLGGHAVLAVGYDDNMSFGGGETGALVIRNSWGSKWGDKGYGYLSYRYFDLNLVGDFWSVLKVDLLSFEDSYKESGSKWSLSKILFL